MRSTDPIKLIQRIIVISDDFVCRSEIKACHEAPFMFHESRFPAAIAHVAPLGLNEPMNRLSFHVFVAGRQ